MPAIQQYRCCREKYTMPREKMLQIFSPPGDYLFTTKATVHRRCTARRGYHPPFVQYPQPSPSLPQFFTVRSLSSLTVRPPACPCAVLDSPEPEDPRRVSAGPSDRYVVNVFKSPDPSSDTMSAAEAPWRCTRPNIRKMCSLKISVSFGLHLFILYSYFLYCFILFKTSNLIG